MNGYRLAKCLRDDCGWTHGGDKADKMADKHTANTQHTVLTITKERMYG